MLLSFLIWFFNPVNTESGHVRKFSIHQTNISDVADKLNLNGIASIFSPRMDFDQWKPLTGRGDPLRNDPTYDYEPPVLERVHYWADENHPQREKYPERKSEVLVLGVSSRKPSIASRPPPPIRMLPRPPALPSKYQDFSYKFSDHYPMTILVPPPPPPPNHKPPLFVISKEKTSILTTPPKLLEVPTATRETPTTPELLTSFAVEESNLIYQSSTIKQNWFHEYNKTTNLPNNTVSSDYAGWGPTTPFEETEAHNIISHTDNNNDVTNKPLSYYKPMLSEAPPPPQTSSYSLAISSFLPTVLPPTLSYVGNTQNTMSSIKTTQEISTETQNYDIESTTETFKKESFQSGQDSLSRTKPSIIDMLSPMISMPMVTDPDRPEDNYYAHASNTIHVFKAPSTEDSGYLETMQTIQPPPPLKFSESSTTHANQKFHVNPHILNNLLHEKPITHTHDPYLHMRFTTPIPTTVEISQDIKSTTETPSVPTYLIIQGHSKVKTYGSKPKPISGAVNNEILNPNETNEVKHLHPIKDKQINKSIKNVTNRGSRAQNLKSLINDGFGSIEIQETDVGIKYDVSDGSEVPIELYRKGIVENHENNYSNKNKQKRIRRQANSQQLYPVQKDSLEDLIYNILESSENISAFSRRVVQINNKSDLESPTRSIHDEKYLGDENR